MSRKPVFTSLLLAMATSSAGVAAAPPTSPTPARAPEVKRARAVDNRPLPPGEKDATVHAPYGAGDCFFCHATNDPQNPGPVKKAGSALCFACHQEFVEIMARRHPHPPAADVCTNCHNPHSSKQRKLLHDADPAAACFDCHRAVKAVAQNAKVKHGAVSEGRKCLNCHTPHASDVEKLLTALPFDLCVKCHASDEVKDANGVALANLKALLAENKVWHAPVQGKDCSACHLVHGADTFRLLVAEYPATFYAPYDLKNYELCFTCHDEKMVSEPVTSTLTDFRNGSRNLHYVHVNKVERGRTCRACHEVHATKQDHQIRDGVPFGPSGWILKLNYAKTATGGSCTRTCHDTRTYSNKVVTTSGK